MPRAGGRKRGGKENEYYLCKAIHSKNVINCILGGKGSDFFFE
jgi:hypothetical protein